MSKKNTLKKIAEFLKLTNKMLSKTSFSESEFNELNQRVKAFLTDSNQITKEEYENKLIKGTSIIIDIGIGGGKEQKLKNIKDILIKRKDKLESEIGKLSNKSKQKVIKYPTKNLINQVQKDTILERQHNRCKNCNVEFGENIHPQFDHIQPISNSGKSITDNIQALCPNCHDHKTRTERVKHSDLKRA